MESEKLQLSPEAKDFFESCFNTSSLSSIEKGSKGVNAALIYERIRSAMEYQEEHLVLKNAISRIARRKCTLNPSITGEILTQDLLRELSWAKYLDIDQIKPEKRKQIVVIVNKYLALLSNIRTGLYSKMDLNKRIIDWMACEIENLFIPKPETLLYVNYASSILSEKLNVNTKRINKEESLLMLKFSVYSLMFKPDLALSEYYLLIENFPDWNKATEEEAIKFARSFDPYYNKIVHYINHPLKNRYFHFVKKYIPPFVVIKATLESESFSNSELVESSNNFQRKARDIYKSLVEDAKTKVLRGSLRALVFIFLTKILLALLLEVPFDRFMSGDVNYLALTINISLPPVIMLLAGTLTKSPPKKNSQLISQSIDEILYSNRIGGDGKVDLIGGNKNKVYLWFNYIYGIYNIVILILIVWLLYQIGFNILSILLFFFFMSLVSFFSFRIRSVALLLAMEKSQDTVTSVIEFLFLPFIKIGKYISERFSSFNPVILIIDLLIEAPLKTIIRVLNLWNGFVNAKKEELEL